MKVNKLIEELQYIYAEEGNLDVHIQEDVGKESYPVFSVHLKSKHIVII